MKVLRLQDTAEKLGLAKSTIWERTKNDPDFPEPIKLGSATGWIDSELDRYIEKKAAERPRQAAKTATLTSTKVS